VSPDPRKSPRGRGGKATGNARAGRLSRLRGPQRVGLIAAAVLLIGLFAGFAIAEGIGEPSVPSGDVAVVQDAPSGLSPVTQEQYRHALLQNSLRAGLKAVPKPSSAQYTDIKTAAVNDLLDTIWIQGEGEELGIDVTPRQIASQLTQIKQSNFRNEAEYQKFIKQSGFTQKDVDTRVKLQILSSAIQKQIAAGAAPVTGSNVEDYYNGAKAQFELPATRDVRLVLNRDKAKVLQAKTALDANDSTSSWNAVAKKYSTDPASKDNGGLRPGLTQGLVEEPLNSKIFAASTGQVSGPVKTPLGWYVFEVEKESPAKTQPLDKTLRQQIRSQLQSQAQQESLASFVGDYQDKWRSRTFCASDFLVERCANFKGTGRSPGAPAACYEANPKKGIPAACPANVVLAQPALPGTVSIASPQGQRMPQRPRPAGLPAAAPTALPGAIPGALPPGVAPSGP
jgi:parvulin-like peptidyl-prolyl isomerase